MVTVRTAKSKGSSFEMDCEASLQQKYPDAFRTHERGYIMEYDIKTDIGKTVYECKRLKGISWNQLLNFYAKLKEVRPEDYNFYILFKSNHQPCLVFDGRTICTFETSFDISFKKHIPIKRGKTNEQPMGNQG